MPWQLEGYTLKPSKQNSESGYAGVTRGNSAGDRWVATVYGDNKQVRLGTFARPEQAALAVAKYHAQMEQVEDSSQDEDMEEEEEEEEEAEESAHRPTEVRLLSRSAPY